MTFEDRFNEILEDAYYKNFDLIKEKGFENHPELHCRFLPFIKEDSLFSIYLNEECDICVKSEQNYEEGLFETFFGLDEYIKITDHLNGDSMDKDIDFHIVTTEEEFLEEREKVLMIKNERGKIENDFDVSVLIKETVENVVNEYFDNI